MSTNIKNIYSLDLTSLRGVDPVDVNELIEKYPFAHNLYALQVLALKANKDPEFNKVLSEGIMNIPDRAHLKALVEKLEELNVKDPEMKEPVSLEKVNDEDLNVNESIPLDKEDEEKLEHTVVPIEEVKIGNDEKLVFKEVINAAEGIDEIENESDKISEDNDLPVDNDYVILEDQDEELMKDADMDLKQIPSIEDTDIELSGFSQWLKNKSKNTFTEVSSGSNTKLESKSNNNEWEGLQEKILSDYHAEGGKTKSKDHGGKKKKKLKSKVIETEVVTEPFALLLEKQGKINKAIKIYEKLSLLYPEKTTYFADKIEYLKNK